MIKVDKSFLKVKCILKSYPSIQIVISHVTDLHNATKVQDCVNENIFLSKV